jgi:hypothetical protein
VAALNLAPHVTNSRFVAHVRVASSAAGSAAVELRVR